MATNEEYGKNLIELNADYGQELLQTTTMSQYTQFQPYFCKQQKNTYCAICSIAIALNALTKQRVYDEDNLFKTAPSVKKFLREKIVGLSGVTLQELGKVLSNWSSPKVTATVQLTSSKTKQDFRDDLERVLSSENKAILLNYHMGLLGQGEQYGGHVSPCVAYNKEKEMVLVLDVWHYGKPDLPMSLQGVVWAPLADLWKAMDSYDYDAKSNRGWVVIEI